MCKYCDKDIPYRICSSCKDIYPKVNFYIIGKKEHICDDGNPKTIKYRRSRCDQCYLIDQKGKYNNEKKKETRKQKYIINKQNQNTQYEQFKKEQKEEELRLHKINMEKLRANFKKYGSLLITFD